MEMNVHYVKDNQFTKYSDHSVTVNGKDYITNIIVTNDGVYDFNIKNVTDIKLNDLDFILEFKPDLVIFGTGTRVLYPDIKVINVLQKNNIGYEVMSIQALCRTYNFLLSENRKIACVLFF